MNLKISCSGTLFDQSYSDAAGHPAMGDSMRIAVGARKLYINQITILSIHMEIVFKLAHSKHRVKIIWWFYVQLKKLLSSVSCTELSTMMSGGCEG